ARSPNGQVRMRTPAQRRRALGCPTARGCGDRATPELPSAVLTPAHRAIGGRVGCSKLEGWTRPGGSARRCTEMGSGLADNPSLQRARMPAKSAFPPSLLAAVASVVLAAATPAHAQPAPSDAPEDPYDDSEDLAPPDQAEAPAPASQPPTAQPPPPPATPP